MHIERRAAVSRPLATAPPAPRLYRMLARRLVRSPVGIVGAAIVVGVLVMAIFAPALAPHNPREVGFERRLQPPAWSSGGSWRFPLGTDSLGRDVLSRVIYGSRISVMVGVSAVLVAGLIGVTVGLVAGYYGGALDAVIGRVTDTFLSVPFIVLALAVVGVLGPGLINLIVVLGVVGWVTFSRVVRGDVLSIRAREYVTAALALGLSGRRILLRHILPNAAPSVIVLATLDVATTIIAESALSFLGLGVQPPTVTWGSMLADGRQHIATSWWLATAPGVAITITVLGIIFLGDWLRDVLDPRLR
jgi:peptide/nickel transport system permease protein